MTGSRKSMAIQRDRRGSENLSGRCPKADQSVRLPEQNNAIEHSEEAMRLRERLDKIEAMLAVLVERQQVRDWYTTQEFARAVGKAEFTIREYCRLGRLRAEKRQSGRGAYPQWVLSHTELERYQRDGLLPCRRPV